MPVKDSELARVPEDAAALLAFITAHGRPSPTGELTVVKPRPMLAKTLRLTVKQLGRAEQFLTSRRTIKAVALVPRNEFEAVKQIYRWTVAVPEPSERAYR
jgi:hypothetical protein